MKKDKVTLISFVLLSVSADCQSQWLRAGGLEEGGEGCEQSKEASEEEGKQSSPRNQHIH